MTGREKRPDILLIITEQHRGDCLGCDGHPVLLTPNMDEIAMSGARFSRFYSDCPVCMPARRTILSGLFPATHGLLGNAEGLEWEPGATLPGVLRDGGYQARWIGRSMHQYPKNACFGYDEVEDGGSGPESAYGRWLNRNAPPDSGGWFGGGVMHNDWTARPWPLPEYLHQTNWVVLRALDFLRRRDPARPFFLTLSLSAAHPPLQPPEFYFNRYLRTGVPCPAIGAWAEPPGRPFTVSDTRVDLRGEALLSARAGYYGLLNHLDDQLRRVINPVIGLRHRRETVICLTSDHGEMLGDHYRWHKNLPYEGAARVPFLFSAPDALGVKPGTVVGEPATLADVMPTLLEAAGLEIPGGLDGRSLLPLMRGEGGPGREFVHFEGAGWQALADARHKYTWQAADGAEQFFDLEADPGETRDLSAAAAADGRLDAWRKRLAGRLAGRPEGFSEKGRLVPGRPVSRFLPHAGRRTPFERDRFPLS